MQSNRPLPKGFEIEGHHILGLIAAGGLSFVYLAYDGERSLIALKEYMPAALALRTGPAPSPVIRGEDQAVFREGMKCFFEEAKALADLHHPNVVRVADFFRANGTAYMAMRYESGRTLEQQVLSAHGASPDEDWLRLLFVRLLNGLREVHAARLLHLDIKPANIWIRDDETPVLIDFGAARRALSGEGARLSPVYTPGFSAPEMHHSRHRLGPWSDIYSVGATLQACVATGEGRYSASLVHTIDSCLRLEPAERPQSVLELQRALAGPVAQTRSVARDSRLALA